MRRLDGLKPYPWRKIGVGGRYLGCTFKGTLWYLHQMVWVYFHGYKPKMLDHINGDTSDNRIENLRECTPAQNQQNSKMKVTNKAGFKGVRRHVSGGKRCWQAKIVVAGKQKSLGYFETPAEAGAAYAKAAVEHFGEFAR